jgi:Putative peptidoglycan binding domain
MYLIYLVFLSVNRILRIVFLILMLKKLPKIVVIVTFIPVLMSGYDCNDEYKAFAQVSDTADERILNNRVSLLKQSKNIAFNLNSYTNKDIRNILIGLGYLAFDSSTPSQNSPWTTTNNPLIDKPTKEAIRKFQQEYKLKADGGVGIDTKKAMSNEIIKLQNNLKRHGFANDIKKPLNKPLYGPATYEAVKRFQINRGDLKQNGIATIQIRKLLELATLPPKKDLQLTNLCIEFQKTPNDPNYIDALEYLQSQIPIPVLNNFINQWRGTNFVNPEPLNLINVCKYYNPTAQGRQTDALINLKKNISPDIFNNFTNRWMKG